jgi:DNA-binding transcriptional regulator YiaG
VVGPSCKQRLQAVRVLCWVHSCFSHARSLQRTVLQSQGTLVCYPCMIQAARKPRRGNLSIRKLRKIIGRTQAEFAALVGVSTDTVISWENGRNRLSSEKAQCIHVATGARSEELVEGHGQVCSVDLSPYCSADFKDWHNTYLGATDEVRADYFCKQASIFLWLLFHAAAEPGPGKLKNRLPAVWGSFLQWADRTAENCRLKPQIKALRSKHKDWLKDQSTEAHARLVRGGAKTRIFRA